MIIVSKKYQNIFKIPEEVDIGLEISYNFKTLDEISKNDIVVYCDAGINTSDNAGKRFNEYIEMLNHQNFQT